MKKRDGIEMEEYINKTYKSKKYGEWRELYLEYYVLFTFIVGVLLGIAATVFLLSPVSAAPYQLNLTTGELIDLNQTNETATIIINIYNDTEIIHTHNYSGLINLTNITITNITNSNVTITNVTEYTNKSYFYNETGNFTNFTNYYTKAEADSRFNPLSETYATYNDLNTVVSKVNSLNETYFNETEKKDNNNVGLWIVAILGAIGSIIAIFMIKKGEDY